MLSIIEILNVNAKLLLSLTYKKSGVVIVEYIFDINFLSANNA